MAALAPPSATVRPAAVALVLGRLAGFALLGVNAGIHAYLWDAGYRTVPTIGALFLTDAVAAGVLALAVLAVPRQVLPVVAAAGALLELGTVGGLYLSTVATLFGFRESSLASLYWPSAATELAGALLLGALAVGAWTTRRRAGAGTWW